MNSAALYGVLGYIIHNAKHLKLFESAQRGAASMNKAHKMGNPFENLRSLTKQILQFLLQTKNCNVNQLLLPKETPVTLEIFHIPNLLLTLPETKLQLSVPLENTNNIQHYISSIMDTGTNKTMIAFTDGSPQSNAGPTGPVVIIKKQGRNSTPIKIAKTVNCIGSKGELEAIKIATIWRKQSFTLR